MMNITLLCVLIITFIATGDCACSARATCANCPEAWDWNVCRRDAYGSQNMELDGQTFFISNKFRKYRRIAFNPDTAWRVDVITSSGGYFADQLWVLQESEYYKGYYYIINAANGYRLGSNYYWSRVYGVNAHFADWQLWKFVSDGAGNYLIINKLQRWNKDVRIVQNGNTDRDLRIYYGNQWNIYDDQYWKLTPRFVADCTWQQVWNHDNRGFDQPYPQKEVVTTGLILTSSQSLSTTTKIASTMKASASYGGASAEMSVSVEKTVQKVVSSGREESWSKEVTNNYVAPPHKWVIIWQQQCTFKSKLAGDDMQLNFATKTDGNAQNNEFPGQEILE